MQTLSHTLCVFNSVLPVFLVQRVCHASLTNVVSLTVVHSEGCEIWTGSLDTGVGSCSVKCSQTGAGGPCTVLINSLSSASLCSFKHGVICLRSPRMLLSNIAPHKVYSLCKIITWPNWLCSMPQVLQLQSLQAFKNKAVPAAALLFVHIDRAHSLSVSRPQFIDTLCTSWQKRSHVLCNLNASLLLHSWRRVEKNQKPELSLFWVKQPTKPKWGSFSHDALQLSVIIAFFYCYINRIISSHFISSVTAVPVLSGMSLSTLWSMILSMICLWWK